MFRPRRGFTLIELLVVIAIIAILSVIVILTLNPAELLRQSRDSNRVSDMSSLNTALSLYSEDVGSSMGQANTVYVSIPDPLATSTLGDQCQGLSLISLPATYTYHCAASSTYRTTNGTGWIPLNFSQVSAGTPLSELPIDPVNQSSSRLYYTYATDGSNYEVTSAMESQKYQLGGSNDVISGDGGTLASVYEKGSKLGLEPLDYGDSSLVGYWTLDEGTGTIAYDYSGNNATGSWNGTQTGTSGYYSAGKIGSHAGTFDGSTTHVATGYNNLPIGNSQRSVFAWIYPTAEPAATFQLIYGHGEQVSCYPNDEESFLSLYGSALRFDEGCGDVMSFVIPTSTWSFVGYVYSAGSANALTLYLNNQSSVGTLPNPMNTTLSTDPSEIGKQPNASAEYFSDLIDDVRVYNRALTAAQVAAIYNGGK